MRMDNQQCFLYRHLDAQGKLLYVGISFSAIYRLCQHKQHSLWFKDIASVTIEKFPSRQEAAKMERKIIKEEKPPYNKIRSSAKMGYSPDEERQRLEDLQDELIIQSTKKWVLGQWERLGWITMPNGKHQHELTGEIV